MALVRYRLYNGSKRYKLKSPSFSGKGSFVLGVALTVTENVSAHKDVTCFDGADGSITVAASGGTAPYVYSLDPNFTTTNSTGVFSELSVSGTVYESTDQYGGIVVCHKTIYVRDANDRIGHVDVQLKSPVELDYVLPDNIIYYATPDKIYIDSINYEYVLVPIPFLPHPTTRANNYGEITTDITNPAHIHLSRQSLTTVVNYRYRAWNNCGERVDKYFTITIYKYYLEEDTSLHQDVTCFDGGDGSITVQASGGVSPYLYSIDGTNWQSSPTFSNLSITAPITEGTDQYGGIVICTKTIYVKDANDQVASVNVQLKSPVELEWLNVENKTFYVPQGQEYIVMVKGVDFEEPYLSTTANNAFIYNQSGYPIDNKYYPGSYTIQYRATNDCLDEELILATFTITVLPAVSLYENTSAHHDVTCFDGGDGSITVIASGGVAPYQYSLDPTFATYNSTGVFSNLSITGPVTEGTDEYGGILICIKTIYVRDANGHTSSLDVQLKSPVEFEWLGETNLTFVCPTGENSVHMVPGVDFQEPYLSTTANNAETLNPTGYPVGYIFQKGNTYTNISYQAANDCGDYIVSTLTITVI